MSRINLEQALKAAKAAQDKAKNLEISTTVSVVDQSGQVVLTMRGDKTGYLTPETSLGKARAAAAFGISTKKMVELAESNPAFWNALPGFAQRVLPTTGAVPILEDDEPIGAIGCGGGTPEQDHLCAQAGAEAILVSTC